MNKLQAFNIAYYFLSKGFNENIEISHLKLQKLVYFAQAWHLAYKQEPLFPDKIEAWNFGPVIPNLYNLFRRFSYFPIRIKEPYNLEELNVFEPYRDILEAVWEAYKWYDATDIADLTHVPGGPWDQARKKGYNAPISVDVIQNYFRKLLKIEEE